MEKLTIKYYHHPRELKKLIMQLIKSRVATNILRYNYVKEYSLDDLAQDKKNNINISQPKVVSIFFDSNNKDKLYDILAKQLGQERQNQII